MCTWCSTDKVGRHDGACAWRPGGVRPPRMIMRSGGPLLVPVDDHEDQDVPPAPRKQRTGAERAEMAEAAVAMRRAGHSWVAIGRLLGVSVSYAYKLGRPALPRLLRLHRLRR